MPKKKFRIKNKSFHTFRNFSVENEKVKKNEMNTTQDGARASSWSVWDIFG